MGSRCILTQEKDTNNHRAGQKDMGLQSTQLKVCAAVRLTKHDSPTQKRVTVIN